MEIENDGNGNGPLNSNVLLLNKHYIALRVISARRAFLFLAKDFAEVICKNNGYYEEFKFSRWVQESCKNDGRMENEYIHTPSTKILIPRVIRLLNYDKVPKRQWAFNRKNIMIRDNHQCQYCGKKYSASSMTIDHIIPRSKQGASSWTNVVTCCKKCNAKKGGKLPQEAGMNLITRPHEPKFNYSVYALLNNVKYKIWKEFIPK